MSLSGGSNGTIDPGSISEIQVQIQLLADEIAALRVISSDDPRSVDALRIVRVKQRSIAHLRKFLPSVQSVINALPLAYEIRGDRS